MKVAKLNGDVVTVEPREILGGLAAVMGLALLLHLICYAVAGRWMVMEPSDLYMPEASIASALKSVWFVFPLSLLVSFVIMPIYRKVTGRKVKEQDSARNILRQAPMTSFVPGITEEISFRFSGLFVAMVLIRLLNILPFGMVEKLFENIVSPIANWLTFGALEPQLIEAHWVLGAAVLVSNGLFALSHVGIMKVGSWFMGMVLFYVTFNYGIVAAIIVHILFNGMASVTVGCYKWFQERLQADRPVYATSILAEN